MHGLVRVGVSGWVHDDRRRTAPRPGAVPEISSRRTNIRLTGRPGGAARAVRLRRGAPPPVRPVPGAAVPAAVLASACGSATGSSGGSRPVRRGGSDARPARPAGAVRGTASGANSQTLAWTSRSCGHTALLDLFDDQELRFILARARHATPGTRSTRRCCSTWFGCRRTSAGCVGYWGLRALIAALREWSRKAELSGDRPACLSARTRTRRCGAHEDGRRRSTVRDGHRGVPGPGAEYDSTGDLRDGVLKLLNLEGQTHPFAVLRAASCAVAGRRLCPGAGRRLPARGDDRSTSISEEVRPPRVLPGLVRPVGRPLIGVLRDVGGECRRPRPIFAWMRAAGTQLTSRPAGAHTVRFGQWRHRRGPH